MSSRVIPSDLLAKLSSAAHVVALSGAGISAESGIPTFREAQTGLWSRYRPEELATPQAFKRNPKLVWEWYDWRRKLIASSQPNPGHLALAALERFHLAKKQQFTLITQNVDGLHARAGSQNIVELHGNIQRVRCFDAGHIVTSWKPDGDVPPLCPHCGSLLRPDVVWFGENLPQRSLELAWQAAENCQVFFSIGTSSLIHPAAALPHQAIEHGASIVEINLNPTPLSPNTEHFLCGKAGELLPSLVNALMNFSGN